MAAIEDMRFVPYASQVCQGTGCQLAKAHDAIAAAEQVGRMLQVIENEDVALWCGVGGHAFSSRDPGRQRVTVQQWDDEANQMRPVAASACGEHARPLQIQTRPKALTNGDGSVTDPAEARRRGYDPSYVKWLEAQASQDAAWQEAKAPAAAPEPPVGNG